MLEVEATVVETRHKTTHVIARHARGMSARQIAKAVQAMESLKRHPREESGNRLLIRRAERIFKELSPGERDMLGQLLDSFEGALSDRDPEAIARIGALVTSFLDRFDGGEEREESADADQ